MNISEKAFEQHIETVLLKSKYQKRAPDNYNKETCVDEELVFKFIADTQSKELIKLKEQHGDQLHHMLISRLKKEIEERGTLDILRKGISDMGSKFNLMYSYPETSLNAEHLELSKKNIFSIIRQLKFSTKNEQSIDTVIFLNGLPIITIELKNYLTKQNYRDAIKQYKETRDPREPLLMFKRCLVHFAVDNDYVFMTTRLAGGNTTFLPFNKGSEGGAGNPVNPSGFKSSYLWEEVLQKKSLLEIISDFLMLVKEPETGSEKLVFPRYHQLDAVRKLLSHARQKGEGGTAI